MTRHISRCRRRSGEFTHLSDYCSAGAVLAGVWACGGEGCLTGPQRGWRVRPYCAVKNLLACYRWNFCAAPAVRERPACEASESSFACVGNAAGAARGQHVLGGCCCGSGGGVMFRDLTTGF